MQVSIGSFGYGYSPLHLLDGISFLVKAYAKVNELFKLFQGGSIVHYIDARCVSANDMSDVLSRRPIKNTLKNVVTLN